MTENSNCPPPAFTHALNDNLLLKFLTTLLMASCPRSPAVPAQFSDRFQFWRETVNRYDKKLKDDLTGTVYNICNFVSL